MENDTQPNGVQRRGVPKEGHCEAKNGLQKACWNVKSKPMQWHSTSPQPELRTNISQLVGYLDDSIDSLETLNQKFFQTQAIMTESLLLIADINTTCQEFLVLANQAETPRAFSTQRTFSSPRPVISRSSL